MLGGTVELRNNVREVLCAAFMIKVRVIGGDIAVVVV